MKEFYDLCTILIVKYIKWLFLLIHLIHIEKNGNVFENYGRTECSLYNNIIYYNHKLITQNNTFILQNNKVININCISLTFSKHEFKYKLKYINIQPYKFQVPKIMVVLLIIMRSPSLLQYKIRKTSFLKW